MNKNDPTPNTSPKAGIEERVLQAVRATLIDVIRDTTTPPGERHPLSKETRDEVRHCLDLITARQLEIAQAEGRTMDERPIFVDPKSCSG